MKKTKEPPSNSDFSETSNNTSYKITPSYSAVVPSIPINTTKHVVFLHFATKHAQIAKSWGRIVFLSPFLMLRPFTNAVIVKSTINARVKNSRATPIEPYTEVPVVLFSTPQNRKIIAIGVKIAHAKK